MIFIDLVTLVVSEDPVELRIQFVIRVILNEFNCLSFILINIEAGFYLQESDCCIDT